MFRYYIGLSYARIVLAFLLNRILSFSAILIFLDGLKVSVSIWHRNFTGDG